MSNSVKRWALAFAPKISYLVEIANNGTLKVKTFSTESPEGENLSPEKILVGKTPVLDLFREGDELYAELGGRGNAFILRLLEKGVNVFRISPQQLNGPDPSALEKSAEETKVEFGRRQRALEIAILADKQSDLFYPMLEVDRRIARIAVYIDGYIKTQRDFRIKAQQRRRGLVQDILWLPDSEDTKAIVAIRERLAAETDITYYLALEKDYLRAISDEALGRVPIWASFLRHTNGIGPSIGARLIAGVQDIRRFPRLTGFRAYVGWSVGSDNKYPRFRRKSNSKEKTKVAPNFDPELKQALFLFGQQVVRQGDKNPYNAYFLKRKAYYQARDAGKASPIVIQRRAVRSAVSDFVDDLWASWWKIIKVSSSEKLPKSVVEGLERVEARHRR